MLKVGKMEILGEREISSSDLEEIVNKAKDWALAHGISLRPSHRDEDQDKVTYLPFTLFPTQVSHHLLQHARLSMIHFNRLIHRVSMDHQFLQEAFKNVIQVDDFTRNLWNIYLAVKDDPQAQSIYLGSFRNDFMFQLEEENNQSLKQVEFNTISVAKCGLSSKVPGLYRYILNCAGLPYKGEQIPEKDVAKGQVAAFMKAWKLYDNPKAIIVFVVLHNERYAMDQRLMEFEIYKQNPNIRVVRKTFNDLIRYGKLTKNRKYLVDTEEVAVVYYRAGYNPTEYSTDQMYKMSTDSLSTRRNQENTTTIIRATNFKQRQYNLDLARDRQTLLEKGDRAIKMAIKNPDQFVLKPQREGGGNNLYGNSMKEFLESIQDSEERCAYILMDLIKPVKSWNYLVKPNNVLKPVECVAELGVYGCFIGQKNGEIYNTETGFLMKSKVFGCDEGGIRAGFGGLDYPFLFDI
ncbi:hypothetical protein LOTGIDRAFT_239115 [Lottia gigantea]|uniref:Glutathione synthetase n=1 Tax=Lottia gigantea TaxID=225164 RepID=V4ALS4_LOTGI|nr:hypothetical protein LOTGIDRAFT_239115 [Lottia gigantea]ESO98072.1 hypothetical protein LOTGIDRAFT_239115 [Lottia gigantea]